MATVTVSVSGSALVTGTKSYTISDAHIQRILNWAQTNYASSLPVSPTNVQILLAWVQGWINASTNSEQQFSTTPPTVPPPIVFS